MTHIQVQNCRNYVLVMSLMYLPVTQSILCLIFLMYVAAMHHLNYREQESINFFFLQFLTQL